MAYWLLKTDPDTYADDLKREADGVDGRAKFSGTNFLRAMQANDVAFIYHSMDERAVVGIARIVSGPYADADDDAWTVVDVQAWKPLAVPVTLVQIKMRKTLAKCCSSRTRGCPGHAVDSAKQRRC